MARRYGDHRRLGKAPPTLLSARTSRPANCSRAVNHRQVSPSDFVRAVDAAPHLASRLLDRHEQSDGGFFAERTHRCQPPGRPLSADLRPSLSRTSPTLDWIIERLTECVVNLTEDEERKKRIAEIIERIRSPRPNSPYHESDLESLRNSETEAQTTGFAIAIRADRGWHPGFE